MSKNVNIKINADSKNAETGLKKVTKSLKSLSNTMSKSSTANFIQSLRGVKDAVGLVTQAVGSCVDFVKSLSESYQKQVAAEKQLEIACKNNPYLNKENANQLKDYASQLQKIGTVGDEELLPFMAQLASSGRTQAEIQDIMSAALDVSASGAMSLESAVKSLNQTYGGTTGQLGKVSPVIKNLTKEQLKNGDAVKVIAEQYKGMAESVAKTAGSAKQFKNAFGDLKEEFGAMFSKPLQNVTNFFTKIISGWTEALSAKRKYKEEKIDEEKASKKIGSGNGNSDDYATVIKKYEKIKTEAEKEIAKLEKKVANYYKTKDTDVYKEDSVYWDNLLKETNTKLNEQKKLYKDATEYIVNLYATKKTKVEEEERAQLEQERQAQIVANNQKAKDAIDAFNKELETFKKQQEIKRKVYNESEKKQAQDLVQQMTTSLFTAVNNADGNITSKNPWFLARMKEIEELQSKCELLQDTNTDLQESFNSGDNDLVTKWQDQTTEVQQLKSELEQLKSLLPEVLPDDATEEMRQQFEAIERAIKNCDEALKNASFEEVIKNVNSIVNNLISSFSTLQNSVNKIADDALAKNKEETEDSKDLLKTQYETGIIDYEKYIEEKNKLDKEAAKKEYKIKLAQWAMNLAMAQAQAAQAVVNALAAGTPPVNFINAAAAGILGLANVATVLGNKPVPPSFSTGGFLTGSSTRGDKIPFMGNAGEAILNPAEQRTFMKMANGNYKNGVSINMPINIENNAADIVNTNAEVSERLVRVTINKAVKSEMIAGGYDKELAQASSNLGGVKLL